MKQHLGKLVVLGIFATAVVLGAFAWWQNLQRGRRSLAFWGRPAAMAIRYGEQVELWRLTEDQQPPREPQRGHLRIAGSAMRIEQRVELAGTPGLVHARHALIEDASFEWDARANPNCVADWSFALHFGGQPEATVVFDTACGQVLLLETGRTAQLRPRLARAFAEKAGQWDDRSAAK